MLEVRSVSRHYGDFKAVDDVSFTVAQRSAGLPRAVGSVLSGLRNGAPFVMLTLAKQDDEVYLSRSDMTPIFTASAGTFTTLSEWDAEGLQAVVASTGADADEADISK